jgi:hypothetical protein
MSRYIFKDEKSRKQIAQYRLHRNRDIDDLNARGLSVWKQKNENGAWERQNYIDNFGEEESETA